MNQFEKSVAESSNAGDVLDQLAGHDVLLPKRDDLETYLTMHTDLACLLDDMCKKVRAAFGPATDLSLEMYTDPEFDDRYLTLYVRQEPYAPDIIDRIDSVCADFHRPLETVSGYFLVTTDFRRPRGTDVL
jgi:hypothetical protein